MTASAQPPGALVLGRYQLGSRIGAGAVGSVFRAVDSRSGQEVVVKFFDGQEDGFPPWASEMRLVMRFKHGNIVACLDTGFDEEHRMWVLVLQLAQGGSLRRALAAGRRFTARQTIELLIDIGSALSYAHAQGVVHRDVKPENILLQSAAAESGWLLTDFGAGRFLPRGEVARSLAGSVEYMAPEVLHQAATVASDQFSLGVLGLELLLGKLPSQEERAELFASLNLRSGLPGILGRLVRSDPEQRFADMVEVVTTLQRELKEMKTGSDIVDLLRPYLQKQKSLSEDALLRLTEEWNAQGSFLDFLVNKNLLPRAAARTIDAVRKGYLDVPIDSVLGMKKPTPLAAIASAPVVAPAADLNQKSPRPSNDVGVSVSASLQSPRQPEAEKRSRPTKPTVGSRISRYLLQESLGEGATATVYRSFHEMLSIPVAIKVFDPIDASADPDAPQRFRREAQILVRLDHPHIVRVLDVDVADQFPFIVMEYGGEMTLAAQIRNLGRLPALRIAQIGLAVADALEASAKEGLLHRDVKPSNILERKDGHIKLVDFGIAVKRMPEGGWSDPEALQGLVFGTPSYIAPEQAQSPDRIDFRADMYALGATLYHAAVGRPTFSHATAYDTILAQINEEPTAIIQIEPGFDPHLAETIHRMLQKLPQDRFSSWAEVKQALNHTLIFQDQPELITESSTSAELDTATAGTTPYSEPPSGQSLRRSIPPSVQSLRRSIPPSVKSFRNAEPPSVQSLRRSEPALFQSLPRAEPLALQSLPPQVDAQAVPMPTSSAATAARDASSTTAPPALPRPSMLSLLEPLRARAWAHWQKLPAHLQSAGLGATLIFFLVLIFSIFFRGYK